jgi:hypothetical protein
MAREVDAGGIDYVGDVPFGHILLDQLLPKAAFHECVRGDDGHEAVPFGKAKEEFGKWNAYLVGARAALIVAAI